MTPETAPAVRPPRAWPTAAVAAVFWAFQLVLSQLDVPMFTRFLSNALSSASFLLIFLILWLSNGTVRGRTRLIGLGLFVNSLVAGILLAHKSFDPVSFMLTAVPTVLTGWAVWIFLSRRWEARTAFLVLVVGIPLGFLAFDLFRWDGLDGRLRSSLSLRWKRTPEEELVASKGSAPAVAPAAKAWTLKSGDSPEFRGAARDGVVKALRIETNWKDVPPALVWKQRVGPGWSGVIAVDGFLVTQEQRGESEAVVCYDAETGREIWAHQDRARFSEGIAGPGPRATPTFRDGRIYSLGGSGLVTCLDAPTGKLVWL
ncbi:MAG: PQQ-binding-like beta-propeller repeat protein, partial [Planctomycetaceae bacterium]|nr:PQQ-binding-like beta-propeller repeat protein [Planctomycetaceae bacterium]